MTRLLIPLAVLLWRVAASASQADYDCRSFIAPAERYYGLPPGLLGAMAMVESGYGGAPYPWALNIGGEAVMAPDYAAAARLLRDRDGRIRRDVAIGCLQIHMAYHLASFGAPEWALLPRYNVWYAALFLRRLGGQYGDWVSAIAHYHASDPVAEARYLCQVAGYLQRQAPLTRRALGLALCSGVREERRRGARPRNGGGP
jgi:hypothetical protein